jgi:hypothetical protein
LTFLGLFAMFSLSPHTFYASGRSCKRPRKLEYRRLFAPSGTQAPRRRLVRYIRKHPIG